MTTIYLVRHGETDWNAEGRIQGQQNPNLNQTGEEQARQLAKTIQHIKFSAIYASDLNRAKRTAEIIALEHQLAVLTAKALRERSSGILEGRLKSETTVELQESLRRFNALSDEEQMKDKSIEGVESHEEVLARFMPFLREIAVAHDGQTILIITHGGVLRVLLAHLGYKPISQLPPGSIDNTGYIKLRSDGVDFFVESVIGLKNGGK